MSSVKEQARRDSGYTRYQVALLGIFLLIWVVLAISPLNRTVWALENSLVLLFVPATIFTGKYFRLSSFSYTLITAFLILHSIGAHYQYAEVPTGYTVSRWFGEVRNHYDRFVHFCFGLLLAYPGREIILRVVAARGLWGYVLPVGAVLSLSALFEIIEWAILAVAGAGTGDAYLGMQGDPWDAQKDMGLAALGATLMMSVVMVINWLTDARFWRVLRESLRVKDPIPLGEEGFFRNGRRVRPTL